MHETAPWFLYNPIKLATYSLSFSQLAVTKGTILWTLKWLHFGSTFFFQCIVQGPHVTCGWKWEKEALVHTEKVEPKCRNEHPIFHRDIKFTHAEYC